MDTKFPLSFARCSHCRKIGAEIDLPSDRYACSKACEAVISAGGKVGAVPPTVSSEKSVAEVLCQQDGLRPTDIAAAVIWLALQPSDVGARVQGLHSLVERYRRENPGPYSKTPLPMDPTLFNVAMRYAAAFAQRALDKEIVDNIVITPEEERSRLATISQRNNPHEESDTEAHAESLYLIYVLLFRPWLAWWDHCMWCALSDADINALPKAPVDRVGNLVVRDDTASALAVLRELMYRSVRYLYHTVGMTKASIKRFLVDGLLSQATAYEAPATASDAAPTTGATEPTTTTTTTEEVVNVNVSNALIGIDMSDADRASRELISKVETVNDGVFDWIKSRARKTYSRVRGLGSSKSYSWPAISSDLYKVYLANVCDGAIARSTNIAIPGMANLERGAQELQSNELFRLSYASAYSALPTQGNNAVWKSEFDQMVGAASRFVSSRDSRDDRIAEYTCKKSSSARIQISEYRDLPSRLAAQVHAMGIYYYSADPKKPKSNEQRRIATQKDIEQLLIELRRKVGSAAASTLLQLISPVITRS